MSSGKKWPSCLGLNVLKCCMFSPTINPHSSSVSVGYEVYVVITSSGPCFNIKIIFLRYGDAHVKDKTVTRLSYLQRGDRYTGKTTFYFETYPWLFVLLNAAVLYAILCYIGLHYDCAQLYHCTACYCITYFSTFCINWSFYDLTILLPWLPRDQRHSEWCRLDIDLTPLQSDQCLINSDLKDFAFWVY